MKLACFLLAVSMMAQEPATRLLIAFHSETGHTEKVAKAIQAGAAPVPGVSVVLRKTGDVRDEDILSADGVIVGTPVQWANLTAETKRLLDRIGEVLWKAKKTGDGRTAGAFCTGGGVAMGKDTARSSILSALLTMRFVVVGGVDAAGFGTLGPEATTGPDDPGISAKEEEEARRFGERFARITKQIRSAH
jgi:NAD(P)H dehydrogenase (quinone)